MTFGKSSSLGLLLALIAWSVQAEPISPSNHVALAPDVAINADGHIAVLWVDRAPDLNGDATDEGSPFSKTDLYVAVSRDGGESFEVPTKVNHDPTVVRGQSINRPRIVAGEADVWHISYAANELHPTMGKPVMASHYTRSVDGGYTFEQPRRLSALPDIDRSAATHGDFMSTAGFQTIAATADGQVHALWIDTRYRTAHNDAGALFTAVSEDGGDTFGADKELLATNVCPCCQLMTANGAGGRVFLGLRGISPDGFRQPVVGHIDTRTGTLSDLVDAGYAKWEIAGCPLKPIALAVHGDRIFTAVYSGGAATPGVYFSHSMDGGHTFTPSKAVHSDATVSDAPTIGANDRSVLAVWHAKTNGPRQIFYRLYSHEGEAVGGITALTTGPDNASHPVVAVRADGRFQVVWVQGDRIHTAILPLAPGEIEIGQR